MSLGTKHGIENNQQLADAGGKCTFGVLTPGAQLQMKGPDDRIAADSRHSRHVEDAPNLGASAPDATAATQSTAVTIKGRQAGQCRDLLAIQHSQFRQLREQSTREHLADPRHGTQQFVALTL